MPDEVKMRGQDQDPEEDQEVAPESLDLLHGADQISTFMFGTPDKVRQIYHLFEKHRLPAWKAGNTLYARKKTIIAWVGSRAGKTTLKRPARRVHDHSKQKYQ
jgi:hypothetical protein